MTIKTILWDNDGILVDTEGVYFQASREILAGVGVELTEEVFRDVSMRQGRSTLELAQAKGLDGAAIDELRVRRNERYSELLRTGIRIMDGVGDVLESLHGRVRMGVVTSSRPDHFEIIHEQTGFLKYFEFVLTRADFEKSKPDPECYRTAVERYDIDPRTCLVIEDTERGLCAAVGAGLQCAVIPHDLTQSMDFSLAAYRFDSVQELPDLLAAT